MPKASPLRAWRDGLSERNRPSITAMAEGIGCHRSKVYEYLSGSRRPNLDTATAIETYTVGAVKATIWRRK